MCLRDRDKGLKKGREMRKEQTKSVVLYHPSSLSSIHMLLENTPLTQYRADVYWDRHKNERRMNDSDHCSKVCSICCSLGSQGFLLSLPPLLLLIYTSIFILFYSLFPFALYLTKQIITPPTLTMLAAHTVLSCSTPSFLLIPTTPWSVFNKLTHVTFPMDVL